MLVRIATRRRLFNTRGCVAESLRVLNSLLPRCNCLHLVLVGVSGNNIAARLIFDRLTLDSAVEWNGLFEVI